MQSKRIRFRDILAERDKTVSLFYWRTINREEFRVCGRCEKKFENDAARAAYFTVIRDGRSIWIICKECGGKERLKLED